VHSLWLSNGAPKIVRSSTHASTYVGDIPDYGFDPLHTRLGRRAIDLWLKSYLVSPGYTSAQIAIALWNLESAACARQLSWPLGEEIAEHGKAADLLNRGLAPGLNEQITAWVSEQSAVLFQARRAVWEAARASNERISEAALEQKENRNDG
jgi:hypothetical protein